LVRRIPAQPHREVVRLKRAALVDRISLSVLATVMMSAWVSQAMRQNMSEVMAQIVKYKRVSARNQPRCDR
jgi:hypothetical protein